MPNVTITQLPVAGPITGTESIPIVQDGQTRQTTAAAIAASPAQFQTFLTLNQEPTLPNSRRLSVQTGLGLTDGGALSTLTLSLNGASGALETALTGIVAKTGSTTVVARTLTASGAGLSITDGSGVSGNPTFALTGQAAGIANLTGPGMVSVGGGSVNARTLQGTANEISITNGNGSSDPTFRLALNPVIPGTSGMTIPVGTTAERGAGANGKIRYNSDLGAYEGYSAGNWEQLSTLGATVTSFSGGATGLTPSSPTSGAVVLDGVLAVDHGGTGQSSYTNGQLLIGSTSGGTLVKSTLTAGSGISITNGPGSITITATTSSGTVTSVSGTGSVNGITLTGTVTSSGSLTLGGALSGVDLTTQVTGTLPVANGGTGLTSLGSGVAAALGQPVTGSGSIVLATSPTLATPNLGTPSQAFLVNATGLPITTGVSGLGTGVATALGLNIGASGSVVVNGGALGTPSSATLTNATGLPVSTGLSGLGAGVASALAVSTGGAGSFVVNGGALGTPSSATLTNATGLPLSTGVTGTLAVANGGTGQTSYTDGQLLIGNTVGNTLTKATLTAGSGVSITNGNGSISISATGSGGTVTSVSWTGGIVSVANATTTPAFTVAGTSGGIPYFSSGTTWASSAVLSANALVVGGGAGAAPSTITTGTGVVTALGVNIGSAGAFVVNGGALGTPSSGTLTNATGLPISTGVSGLGTGVASALAINTGTAGSFVVNGGALGTPSSGTLTNATGLPISTGVSGLGTGVATALAVNTGTAGAFVVNGGALGTPSSGTLTNVTGLPLSTGVTGTLGVANGGTGQTTYTDGELLIGNSTGNTLTKATLTQGTGITITNGAGAITVANASPMTYPAAGIPNSTGTAWGTSYSTTGSGTVVALATSPSFTTPTLGVASATSINKVAITAPATSATLTIADGKTLTASNTLTFTGTDGTSFAYPGSSGTVVTLDATQTLTNKRITARVSSTASIASPLAWNSDNFDQYAATAQAGALTINADSGTPTDGQRVIFRFKDNGTPRALTWTTGSTNSFQAIGVTLPTTTTANKVTYVGAIYNAASSRWDAVAVTTEA